MPKRTPSRYTGVSTVATASGDETFYIRYKRDGRATEERAGRRSQGMTAAKANKIRAERLAGKTPSNEERRAQKRAAQEAEQGRWTLDRLWKVYCEATPASRKVRVADESRWRLFITGSLGRKTPEELRPLDLDRLRINLLKQKSPQTAKHVLGLIKRVCNFGAARELTPALSFKVSMPKVDNQVTEDLNDKQLTKLVKALDEDEDGEAASFLRLIMVTGLRRGEVLKLQWRDVDLGRGFLAIVKPKSGHSRVMPLNEHAKQILAGLPAGEPDEYVFPHLGSSLGTQPSKRLREFYARIKAALPADFRVAHGLRHAFASRLASSGEVDLFQIGALLGHRTPAMTARYSHLRDDVLRRASEIGARALGE